MVLTKRLMRELQEIKTKPLPPGVTLVRADNLEEWYFDLTVPNPLYADKTFRVRLRFVGTYPLEAPETVFVTTGGFEAPQMMHCYQNGHVCASILGAEWSPVLNAQSVLITLQSMLASSKVRAPAEVLLSNLGLEPDSLCCARNWNGHQTTRGTAGRRRKAQRTPNGCTTMTTANDSTALGPCRRQRQAYTRAETIHGSSPQGQGSNTSEDPTMLELRRGPTLTSQRGGEGHANNDFGRAT
ncbi:hypothetical protein V8E36_006503 [Tilletia maclaganii]